MDDEAQALVPRREFQGTQFTDADDPVAREEPLEIRIAGVPIAVTMRTPGHDEELVRGFLVTERVVDDPGQIASVRPCSDAAEGNVVQVVLKVPVDLARLRRNFYASSSCGVCGKATLAGAMACAAPLPDGPSVDASVLYALPARLRAAQEVFAATGGLHAAGLFDAGGAPLAVREDIGRHNAVDKVVGWAAASGARGTLLMVSGRISFEIAQKALAARIPIVAAVSAPSSLAVDLGARANLTLIGFLRGERLCVYSGRERIRG
jgi:FdhD protein